MQLCMVSSPHLGYKRRHLCPRGRAYPIWAIREGICALEGGSLAESGLTVSQERGRKRERQSVCAHRHGAVTDCSLETERQD